MDRTDTRFYGLGIFAQAPLFGPPRMPVDGVLGDGVPDDSAPDSADPGIPRPGIAGPGIPGPGIPEPSIFGGITCGTSENDLLYGGLESDTLYGERGNDILQGGSGADLPYGDADNDIVYGDDGDDTLSGGAGNDVLNGGLGIDVMWGSTGDDSYVATSSLDRAIELAGGGTDRVVTTVSHTLGANIETLRMIGTADLVGAGNAGRNTIIANSGATWLLGQGGNDMLRGEAGGINRYGGGTGTDWSYGGAGVDSFIFADGWGSDQVHNFTTGPGGDRIALGLVTNITSYADLQANHLGTDAFGNALVHDGANVVRLMGIAETALTVGNFLF